MSGLPAVVFFERRACFGIPARPAADCYGQPGFSAIFDVEVWRFSGLTALRFAPDLAKPGRHPRLLITQTPCRTVGLRCGGIRCSRLDPGT